MKNLFIKEKKEFNFKYSKALLPLNKGKNWKNWNTFLRFCFSRKKQMFDIKYFLKENINNEKSYHLK